MKQRIRTRIVSMALALLLLLALPVPALANESVVQNQQDYADMVEWANKQSPSIPLTDQYFSVNETFTGEKDFKFELSTNSDQTIEAFFCVLLRDTPVADYAPAMGLGMAIPMSAKAPTVSFSQSKPYTIDRGSAQGQIGYGMLNYGARIGLNVLTEVKEKTIITLKIYAKNSQIGEGDEPVKTVTFTVQPKTPTPADAITLNITGEDRSTAAEGLQVYAEDTVTVGFTVPENYTGTNLTFTYNSAVFRVSSVPDGWTKGADGSYSYSGAVTADALGKFTFQAIAQSDDNQTGEFTIKDNTNTEKESVTVIYKTIQYTIQDANKVYDHYQLTVTYNGKPQGINIQVTEPAAEYTIRYAEANGDNPTQPGEYGDASPVYTNTKKGATGYESRYIYYKIEAKGYKTVNDFAVFVMNPAEATITPKDTTIYVGDTAPTTFGYDVTGLLAPDTITTPPTFNIAGGPVDTSKPGTYTITATGASAGDNYKILYKPGTLTVKEKTVTPGGGSGGGTHAYYTLYFVTNGGSAIGSVTGSAGSLVDLGGYVPVRSGYAFTGWYADPALTKPVYSVRLTGSTTVYAGWRPLMTPPKTGDGPSAWGWVCLLPLGCLGLAALWRRRAR